MKLYSLAVNGTPIVEVEVDVPQWLPVRPSLNQGWLRRIVAAALKDYFQRPSSQRGALLPVASRS